MSEEPTKKESAIRPPPPISMSREEFIEAQRRYIEKYAHLVRPEHTNAIELMKMANEYGRITVTYLVVGNGAGLASLLALYPLLKESNQIWLFQQMWVAIAFGVGLFLAVVSAAISYLAYANGAALRWNFGHHNDTWIKGPEFNLDKDWVLETLGIQEQQKKRADRAGIAAVRLSAYVAVFSGLCWICGAIGLARNFMNAYPT